MIQFYIVPIEQVGSYRGPEYLPWRADQNPEPILAGVRWSCKDYGLIPQMVCAADVTTAQHVFLDAQADVWAFGDLDLNIGAGERNQLGNFLEGVAIPSNWIQPTETNRTALRTITGMFLFMQRLTAITNQNPLTAGLTLNTQYQNLPALWGDAITQAAADLGYDISWLTGNMTVRQFLKRFAEEWGLRPIYFGFTTL